VTSYQVFADGKRLGSFGGFPPHATVYDVHRHLVLLPQTQAAQMEIAIRVWHWPHWAMYYGGGMVGAPRIGDAGALKDWMTLQDKSTFWQSTARNCTALLCFLLAYSIVWDPYPMFGLETIFPFSSFPSKNHNLQAGINAKIMPCSSCISLRFGSD